MRRKRFLLLVLVAVIALQLSGCTADTLSTGQEKQAFRIITSFYPIYIAALNVAGGIDGVEVTNLTQPQTGCLHDYQLSTKDLKTLEEADVFVVNGAGMEVFLDKALSQNESLKIIEASKGIPLLKDQNGDDNPHVWVSVTNAVTQVQNIAQQLSDADPTHKLQYEENAKAYISKLETLKKEMHTTLQGITHREIVTFHEAFPYFAEEFGLHIVAVIEREPGTSPTARELEETIDTVKKSRVGALFAEPQYSAKAAQVIAEETGAKLYTLDPVVTGTAGKNSYDDYLKAMRQNLKTLKEALQ